MFPFHDQNHNELVFQIPSNNSDLQLEIDQLDPILSLPVLESSTITAKTVVKSPSKSLAAQEKHDGSSNAMEEKRITRNEIERQRRQRIAHLFVSLRSLLPLEYIKGTRSKSDHMLEAVNYIKHLRKKIEELEVKRENLKQLSNSNSPNTASGISNSCLPSVTVSPCYGGLEILINSTSKVERIPLSKVLRCLIEEGLNVISSVSNKVNDTRFHTIKAEVSDMMIDPILLQQKLASMLHT